MGILIIHNLSYFAVVIVEVLLFSQNQGRFLNVPGAFHFVLWNLGLLRSHLLSWLLFALAPESTLTSADLPTCQPQPSVRICLDS